MMSRERPSPLEQASALAGKSFADRTVLVAGGGSGIGEATACLAARLGAQVIVCGRKLEKLTRVSEAIRARGLRCEPIALDVRDRSAVDVAFADIFARPGGIDLLINSAGGQFPQDAIDFSEKGWRAVIDTNLTGTFNVMQCAARHWRDRGSPGSIVTIVVSSRGLHQVAHSCAARAGVIAFTEAVAVEWAPLRIRVNCIAPGAIESSGWAVYDENVRRRYPQACPMRRAGTPFEIAEAALFVGGPGGSFITGQTLHVNGGSNLWGETWTLGKPPYFIRASRTWES
jgi:citronellol/citronellal dehydrogenase